MILNGYTDIATRAADSQSFNDPGDSLLLSASEQLSLIRTILSSSGVRTLADFSAWLSWDLDALLHHRAWACGLGGLHPEAYKATYWFASRSSNEPCSLAQGISRIVVSPVLTRWLAARRPQICVRVEDEEGIATGEDLFGSRRLDNAVVHCQMDPANKWTSVFCFANLREKPGFRERLLLDVLIPHLHATLCRVIVDESSVQVRAATPPVQLTVKELSILRHIGLGRTNAEIADVTHKSVFTVNNQVVKVLAKLGARNRTQAVFMARELGLLKS